MNIKIRTSSGIAYKAEIPAKTPEEAAKYLSSAEWVKSSDGCMVHTPQITMFKEAK